MKPTETVLTHPGNYRTEGKTEPNVRLSYVGRQLAAIKGADFRGEPTYPINLRPGVIYYLPVFTLLGYEARRLNIRTEDHLYGGVAEREHETAKGVMHGLARQKADHPLGWNRRFAQQVEPYVLPGITVYSKADADRALWLLKRRGHQVVRGKPHATGGDRQSTIKSSDDLAESLTKLSDDEVRRFGYSFEAEIEKPITFNIGHVVVNDLQASFIGLQKTTTDIDERPHYGGTDMYLVRGEFSDLTRRVQRYGGQIFSGIENDNLIFAIDQAQQFDELALNTLHVFGSRRCYDVVQGETQDGQKLSGVTDQSWRQGGASPGEVNALAKLRENRNIRTLSASTFYLYGAVVPNGLTRVTNPGVPENADIIFKGVDRSVYRGQLTSAVIVNIIEDSFKE